MSIRRLILSPAWIDCWLAALTASAILAALLWRLGDGSGTRVALGVFAVCVGVNVVTAAAGSAARHLAIGREDEVVSSN
jgi:crotonobetainyl-CoA:carnitine CoA-transferase CaiB-like acyl-CoA transferase